MPLDTQRHAVQTSSVRDLFGGTGVFLENPQ
jgi:hypothetical protein